MPDDKPRRVYKTSSMVGGPAGLTARDARNDALDQYHQQRIAEDRASYGPFHFTTNSPYLNPRVPASVMSVGSDMDRYLADRQEHVDRSDERVVRAIKAREDEARRRAAEDEYRKFLADSIRMLDGGGMSSQLDKAPSTRGQMFARAIAESGGQ
jgi:hypothetical protein